MPLKQQVIKNELSKVVYIFDDIILEGTTQHYHSPTF